MASSQYHKSEPHELETMFYPEDLILFNTVKIVIYNKKLNVLGNCFLFIYLQKQMQNNNNNSSSSTLI